MCLVKVFFFRPFPGKFSMFPFLKMNCQVPWIVCHPFKVSLYWKPTQKVFVPPRTFRAASMFFHIDYLCIFKTQKYFILIDFVVAIFCSLI